MPTRIEWADETWNPIRGCTPVSAGCDHCWAKRFHERDLDKRFVKTPFSTIQLFPERLSQPSEWKKPRKIFVQSMGDLFHEDVPEEFIERVFLSMQAAWWHTFLVLTKRPGRLLESFFEIGWDRTLPPNIWIGVSAENELEWAKRIQLLHEINSSNLFVSLEPLLAPIYPLLESCRLGWIIVGGETGPGARRMDPDWVGEIRDACVEAHVPFFFKGWGDHPPKMAGALLDGQEWHQFPPGFPGV
jgi:protein gp37